MQYVSSDIVSGIFDLLTRKLPEYVDLNRLTTGNYRLTRTVPCWRYFQAVDFKLDRCTLISGFLPDISRLMELQAYPSSGRLEAIFCLD